MSGFDSFVTIDLETTGLDPGKCEIIELGAVYFKDGQLAGYFSELVKPSFAIPREITRLTGINDDMVKTAPGIDMLFEKYLNFSDQAPWIVGHNVSFDLGFLKPHCSKKQFALLESRSLDTSILARILLPRLQKYSLAALADYLHIVRERSHRAYDDCLTTAGVYLRLIAHLASIENPARDAVGRILFGTGSIDYFRESISKINPVPVSIEVPDGEEFEDDGEYPDNVTGNGPPEKYDDYLPVDLAAIENCFLPGGLLSKKIPSFEYRSQQAAMAIKVASAFNRSQFLLAEAPTGVGKSLAYLLPATWWASQNRERVIISTQTKSLQSQLFYKDLPQIQEAMGYDFKATLLKGKSNYICLYKYYELLAEAESTFEKKDREALAALSLWVRKTKTGDISECHGFSPGRYPYLWNRASCEGSFCLGQACLHAEKCFLLKVRREAQVSQVIITNHHLTFADFSSGGELALSAGNIIFDEAHNLEKVAASYLGNVLDKRSIDSIISEMYTSRPTQSGYLLNLKLALSYQFNNDDLLRLVDNLTDSLLALNHSTNSFFDSISDRLGSTGSLGESREIAYTSAKNPCDTIETSEFIGQLDKTTDILESLAETIRETEGLPKKREMLVRLEASVSDLKSVKSVSADLLYAANDEYVYWIERQSSARYAPRFLSAPLEVGKLLDKRFYDHMKTAIFSSATLTIEKRFDFIIKRLGLDSSSKDRVDTICLDSPFDINSEVAVIIAGFLPSPKQSDFEAAANEALKEILTCGAKKGMILFTSHRSLRNSAEYLRQHLEKKGIELFSQDSQQSSDRIFRRFKSARKAVLFGTDTFWEGIDLPGELLELLVLFKLPFTVPDRPWFKANLDRIDKEGGSSFAGLSLPDAVVKFRQGFGRLIRTSNDRGCVVVLDSRVDKYSFGRVFLNSVDGKKIKATSAAEISLLAHDWIVDRK
jgi:ATP-dependent DNA helicase DinG